MHFKRNILTSVTVKEISDPLQSMHELFSKYPFEAVAVKLVRIVRWLGYTQNTYCTTDQVFPCK